jgi:alkylhydroperoxidase/carboxymuconolactone decarboxylase family protein YurZ
LQPAWLKILAYLFRQGALPGKALAQAKATGYRYGTIRKRCRELVSLGLIVSSRGSGCQPTHAGQAIEHILAKEANSPEKGTQRHKKGT